MLDFDFAFEDEVGWAGEGDVFERLIAGFLETDGQGIAAFDIDFDGRFRAGEQVVHERASDHAGAAGEGFVFDSAFVGADGDVIGSEHFGEVCVGSARCEV